MRATGFVESYVESYFDAWNHHDPRGVAEHLTNNGIYRDVPENVQRSQADLIDDLDRFFSSFHHRYELVGDVLSDGRTVAFQYRMIPTRRSGHATEQEIYRGAEFVTLEERCAALIIDYYDAPPEMPAAPAAVPARAGRGKYARSGLTDSQLLFYKSRIERLMREQRVFLDPGLTLPRLAEMVGCSVNHLSQVINAGFGMRFFDYVNRHRIERAKTILCDAGNQGPILELAFGVGFNSNSAFYSAFKKHVGTTPSEFRDSRGR